jgi:hypothetical protein
MFRTSFWSSALTIAGGLLLAGNASWADGNSQGSKGNEAGDDRAVRLLDIIPVPVSPRNSTAGGLYSFDISWVDQATQKYYLADRSNVAIDVVDAKTDAFVTQFNAVPSFRGFSGAGATSGPNGVVAVTIGSNSFLFVTDAKSRVVSMNATTGATISDVSTGGADNFRADELAYDPRDGLLLVINPNEPLTTAGGTGPFGTLIKVDKTTGKLTPPTLANRIPLTAANGVDATAGAEQPVWEPVTGKFFLSIPQIGPVVSNGGVVQIAVDPKTATGTVEAVFPVQHCGPAGLTVGPRQDLFIGCNTVFDTAGNVWDPLGKVAAEPRDVIIDAKTGKKDPTVLDANVFGVGAGDEVWFNPGDGNYYATGSGSPFGPRDITPAPTPPATTVTLTAQGSTPLGVVDAKDQKVLQLVTTFNVPAVTTGPVSGQHPAGTAHSVAANAKNNHVFVPLAANNAFLSPDGTKNCLTGCIAVFGHPDED